MNIKIGFANSQSHTAQIFLITGSPVTGKIWLIQSITELAKLMDFETHIKTSFMGIAALNIDGYTKDSFVRQSNH